MRFQVKTLVDITDTGIRRRHNKESFQQDNCDTVIQTIGLRANPENIHFLIKDEDCDTQFGSRYKGTQKVWVIEFEPNIPDSVTLDMLINDFDLVPFLTDLDETVEFAIPCFYTQDNELQNILFLSVA